ncbi:ubiquinone biosynthesis accessory factor UbiJ [Crenobacter cavernae]|uniref:Ubiquinone biosynthesis accessory factor UbiJ n=1 Tax=Crenobacter cavernae TaxID=2290923 RepID=A0A345YA38_9NEIS|nr:sterol-binding protein [Crenobacter cavernae]AXK40790.1 sterol-binding protein [Crenobacter cavernae]
MRLSIAVFNHLINQHPVLRAELATRAGRRVAVRLPPLSVEGVITEEGWLAACEGEPEATVRLKHGAAISTLTGREPALSDVLLEGDAELASLVARVIAKLKWDATEDASRLVGDAAAHRLETVVKGVLGFKGAVGWRLAENWLEHLREEAPLLAKKHDVNRFVAEVDALRDDIERCDKRLARLEAACQAPIEKGD